MSFKTGDRVRDTTTTTGTGTVTLANSPPTGFQSFGSVLSNGDTCYYGLQTSAGAWETGLGAYSTSGPTLARTTVYGSSNSNALINLSGTTQVFLTNPAHAAVAPGTSGNIPQFSSSGILTDSGVAASGLVSLQAFDPNSASPDMWVRADDIAGADGTAITSFTSSDAHALTLSGTGTLKTGVNGINGHNILRFVPASSNKFTTATGAPPDGDFYVGLVCKINNLTGFQHLFSWGDASGSGFRRGILKWGTGVPSSDNELTFNTHGNDTRSSAILATGTTYIIEVTNITIAGITFLTIYLNGVAVGASVGTLSAYTATAMFLGCNPSTAEFADADIAEVIIGHSNLSTLANWRKYAADRYGVTLASGQPLAKYTTGSAIEYGANLVDSGSALIALLPWQNAVGETEFDSIATVAGGVTSNVLSLWHAQPTGSAAARLLRYSDKKEVGAVGYQNGGGSFYLDGYVFLSGTTPYPYVGPIGSATSPGSAPAGVCLGQEGAYIGAYKTSRRIDCGTDWSIKFLAPDNTTILFQVDPDGKTGFYGHATTAQQLLATGAGHTVDDVITALQTLGLVKQS